MKEDIAYSDSPYGSGNAPGDDAELMQDAVLLQLLMAAPERGMEEIMHAYGRSVNTICVSFLKDYPAEDIEEAESDTFLKLWQYRDRIRTDNGCSLKSYLFAIARNVSKNRLRKDSRKTVSLEELAEYGAEPAAEADAEDAAIRTWQQETVSESLEELGEPDRSVFLLRYYLEQSVKEIAGRLDIPVKKVENILYRGKEKLRKILAKKGVTSE